MARIVSISLATRRSVKTKLRAPTREVIPVGEEDRARSRRKRLASAIARANIEPIIPIGRVSIDSRASQLAAGNGALQVARLRVGVDVEALEVCVAALELAEHDALPLVLEGDQRPVVLQHEVVGARAGDDDGAGREVAAEDEAVGGVGDGEGGAGQGGGGGCGR